MLKTNEAKQSCYPGLSCKGESRLFTRNKNGFVLS